MSAPEASENCDPRVEGAIESLNTRIDALNTLEDIKMSAEGAAKRAEALVKEELDELNRSNAKLIARVAPFLAAREQAQEAIQYARATEVVWREATEAQTAAKAAVRKEPKDAALKQVLELKTKQAASARKEAKRSSRVAEQRAVKLGELGEALQRAGFKVQSALRDYADYCERRDGLEQVLQHTAARLRDMENAKEAATVGVNDAMGDLEALSNELHETEGGGESQTDGAQELDGAGKGFASPSGWMSTASWRPSRDWSDHEDDEESLEARLDAGQEWSEEESGDEEVKDVS